MPLFDYTCECGAGDVDVLVFGDPDMQPHSCSLCGKTMQRKGVYKLTTVGPVWANVEAYERALLTPQERASPEQGGLGLRITGPDDVRILEERMLQQHGLRPLDPSSAECVQSIERDLDLEAESRRVLREEAKHAPMEVAIEAAAQHIEKVEIKEESGWTDTEYTRWSNTYEAAERALESGSLPIGDPGAVGDAGQPDPAGSV